MNTTQATLQTVSGHIEQFRKITPTLATFRVNGIACKAEHLAVGYVERWSKNADCVYEFQGAYQQSRFGREFVVAHGRPEDIVAESATTPVDQITPKEKQIAYFTHRLKQDAHLGARHFEWIVNCTSKDECEREAARRLLQRALQVEAPTRSLCSPSTMDRCSGETQGPTSDSDTCSDFAV